jgi:signal peptidase I
MTWRGDRSAAGPGEGMQSVGRPKPSRAWVIREFAETILFTLLIYVVVRTFVFENYRVLGRSMEPTLENDQFLVVDKLGYRLYDPRRGDIVVFNDPSNGDRKLIKRVVGLPGESIEIKTGEVLVNGSPLDEAYIPVPWHSSRPPSTIPEGQYFVLGDNRNNSSDSRSWGMLPRTLIVGKAWLSYWPPGHWGLLPHAAYGEMP